MQDLETNYGREVHSREIGAKVMQKLHLIDAVAYVRYASVYRHFQDIGEFIDEIKKTSKRGLNLTVCNRNCSDNCDVTMSVKPTVPV